MLKILAVHSILPCGKLLSEEGHGKWKSWMKMNVERTYIFQCRRYPETRVCTVMVLEAEDIWRSCE